MFGADMGKCERTTIGKQGEGGILTDDMVF